ncbi:MAG TPA: sigma-70 family RNA polymerase sigma factor [Gemmataceae bacterium]|nr:sigma-70 family RNA polymerase sigma factor [Gemmataceae bacterium]
MAISQPSALIRYLCRFVFEQVEGTDGQLLTGFIERRDEVAFDALVRRHGPMVLGVCQRILRNEHDAEDAFQATFLVLVRKAASVVPREMVGNWLYGVAHNTALKAKAVGMKRRGRERQMAELPEPGSVRQSQDLWDELKPVLDQELSRLPDKYRVPIVLCDLEGKSHQEAAKQLGWPQGTLSGRLSRARALLAKRLTRHGPALSVGSLAAALSQNAASACLPTSLANSTVKAAILYAAGQTALTTMVSPKVAALVEGVLKAMLLSKLVIATSVLAVAVIGVGAGSLVLRTQAGEESPTGKVLEKEAHASNTDPQAKTDEDHMQGTWVIVKFEQSNVGLPKSVQELLKSGELRVIISGDAMTFPGWKGGVWNIKLDETVNPHRMTLRMTQDATVPAIYELHGDELKICYGQKNWQQPPSSFDVNKVQTSGVATSWVLNKSHEESKVRRLQKERLAALKGIAAERKGLHEQGRLSVYELLQANSAVLKTELELCESDAARILVHEKLVANAKENEEMVARMFKDGRVVHSELLTAQANRLEAEIDLERTKAKAAPKPK